MYRLRDMSVKQKKILGVCLTILVLVVSFAIITYSNYIQRENQNTLIISTKDLAYFEYFHLADGASAMTERGIGYGIGGGLGRRFGKLETPLWNGTCDVPPSLQLVPVYFLRISDSQVTVESLYADLTINAVLNSSESDISALVSTIGFTFQDTMYVVTSNDIIYKVADKTFFKDIFSFLKEEHLLPLKVR